MPFPALRPAAALVLAATVLAPLAASADQRSYAHVHRPAQQQGIDPGTASLLGSILDEVLISTPAGLQACLNQAGGMGNPEGCDCFRRHLTIRGEMHKFNTEVCGR